MKLEKAIEALQYSLNHNTILRTYFDKEALKLGIEALKRLAFNRLNTIASSDELLPGETDESNP